MEPRALDSDGNRPTPSNFKKFKGEPLVENGPYVSYLPKSPIYPPSKKTKQIKKHIASAL